MRISDCIGCQQFPCQDVRHDHYTLPDIEIDPEAVRLVLISEAAPADPKDYYYVGPSASGEKPHFEATTLHAFQQAGMQAASLDELLGKGIYFTTAVKCGKTGYGIKAATIKECSLILERELALFPNPQAYLLMGDVAIKGLNYIAIRQGAGRAVPAGSTYKIRGGEYSFQGRRAFPSYLQAGPSYGIEKSKQRMIAEDIAAALELVES